MQYVYREIHPSIHQVLLKKHSSHKSLKLPSGIKNVPFKKALLEGHQKLTDLLPKAYLLLWIIFLHKMEDILEHKGDPVTTDTCLFF